MQGLQKLQVLDRLRTLHMNSGSASFLNAHLLMIQRSKQKKDCLYFFLCIVLYSFPLTFATQKYVFLGPLSLEKNRSPP